MELTPTLILNLVLLIIPPAVLVLVFRQWLARHIRWTVALTALCDVLLFWDELFYTQRTVAGYTVSADNFVGICNTHVCYLLLGKYPTPYYASTKRAAPA